MPPPLLRILHLEDLAADATLVRETIVRSGIPADIRVVEDGPSFERALDAEPAPDLILCDYSVPVLRGPAILDLARRRRPETPVLFVSGAVGEQQAVALLRQGATDFVSKDSLDRLPLAIRRAVDEVQDRRRQREAEERYRLTVHSCPDALVTLSPEGVVLEWNPQAERTFGWARAEVIGQVLPQEMLPERVRAALGRLDPSRLAGRRVEMSLVRRDGKEIPVELTVWTMPGTAGYSAFVRDLSERKLLEEQFLQAQKMETVGRLAGGAAHDFNNLLTVVLGYGEMALATLPPEDPNHGRVAEMVAAAERAMNVTRQLLGFTRKQDARVRSVDLRALVAGTTRMLERLVGEDIRIETEPAAASWVWADPGQLEQVLVNLVVNARDAMPDGGRVAISTADVSEAVDATEGTPKRRRGDFVRLTVRDSGAGMSDPVRARIFEPFYTTKPEGKGTGLGLSTVRSIVQAAGGAVDVESAPGQGSAFHVYLPRAAPGASSSSRLAAVATEPASATGAVLVVEDEEIVRRLAAEVLRQAGYEVLTTTDGDQALRVLRERREEIRLVLTDNVMPRMSGRALAARLAAERPGLKVIFMSGYVDRGIEGADALGAAFLEKPFTPAALLAKVKQILG